MVVRSLNVPGEEWIARSSGCIYDAGSNNRPVIGSLEINSAKWDDSFSREDKHFVILHEITHTLVFSITNTYTDNWTVDGTQTYAAANLKITDSSSFRGVAGTMIVTPKVVEKARKLFDCPTLAGVELET
jgi:hypothetical protein